MSRPKFSIIIPTLDEESYLPRILQDLNQQTIQDFEIVIVDCGSTDRTKQIVDRAINRFSPAQLKFFQTPTKGVSHQRNLGAKKAKGDWLIFLDADSRVPSFFLDGTRYQLSKKELDFWMYHSHPDDESLEAEVVTQAINARYELLLLIEKPAALEACMGAKKTSFRKVGGFNTEMLANEGQELIREAMNQDMEFSIMRDPWFIFSLRRYQKDGGLRLLASYIPNETRHLLGLQLSSTLRGYPMLGGSYYKVHKPSTPTTMLPLDRLKKLQSQLEKFFERINPQ